MYLMASRKDGATYLGVTDNLEVRVSQHKSGKGGEHTSKYQINNLVWFERFPDKVQAREQEFRMKKWSRAWKVALIEDNNPEWLDLSQNFNQ